MIPIIQLNEHGHLVSLLKYVNLQLEFKRSP